MATSESEHDFLEVPSCIESLVSSAQQLQQLAQQIVDHHQRLLLVYGYAVEPRLLLEPGNQSANSTPERNQLKPLNLSGGGGGDDEEVMSFTTLSGSAKGSPYQLLASASKQRTACGPNLAKVASNKLLVQSLALVPKILPLLSELSSLVERCFATVESTLKRAVYHLTRAAVVAPSESKGRRLSTKSGRPEVAQESGEFRISGGMKIDPIFYALMDLIYALECLEQTLKNHTNLAPQLGAFLATCKLITTTTREASQAFAANGEQQSEEEQQLAGELAELPLDRLQELIEFVGGIKLTLALEERPSKPPGGSLFGSLLSQLEHLDLILNNKETTRSGLCELSKLMGDFLVFYCEHMLTLDSPAAGGNSSPLELRVLINFNLCPTLFMDSISKRLLGLSGLFALHATISKRQQQVADSRRLNKVLNQTIRKHSLSGQHSIVACEGSNCHLLLGAFLRAHLNQVEPRLLDSLDGSLERPQLSGASFSGLARQTVAWLAQLKSLGLELGVAKQRALSLEAEQNLLTLHWRGLKLAVEIQELIRNSLAIHQHSCKPINKNNLILTYRLIVLLKCISSNVLANQLARGNHSSVLANNLIKLEQAARVGWRKWFHSLRGRQLQLGHSSAGRLSLATLLALSAAGLKPELLASRQGRALLSIYLSQLSDSKLGPASQSLGAELNRLLQLAGANSMLDHFERALNCSHLFWSHSHFGAYYNHALEQLPGAFNELHYFHQALDDIPRLFVSAPMWNLEQFGELHSTCSWLLGRRDRFLKSLASDLMGQFRSDYLERLCQELEVELRLQTHRDLCADEHNNPFKRKHLYNFEQIFAQKSETRFQLMGQTVWLRQFVEQYLNKICYNLTSLAPHDWFAYDSMMNLAQQRYGLKFANTQLPAQTLDCGLDLLDMIRNLSLFVSRYGYDLTNQLFIEKSNPNLTRPHRGSTGSGSIISTGGGGGGSLVSGFAPSSAGQWLNVVQVGHVSRSVHTHGFGVLDSAVNCAYQTLKRLLNQLSRQLLDERLCSALQKELLELQLTGNNALWSGKIPFERAKRLGRRFRLARSNSLKEQPAGVDLDSIRQTVTQLGNVLAFVRLLKSGALHCASKSVDYAPESPPFRSGDSSLANCATSEFAAYQQRGEARLVACLRAAGANLDQCLSDLEANFSPKTNYLNIIVKLFSDLMAKSKPNIGQNAKQQQQQSDGVTNEGKEHLELFFVLIPALTIDYVDHLIGCKERLSSRSSSARFGALISDDGFSVGLAFLLTILGQSGHFRKLQWLEQTSLELGREIGQIERRLSDSKYEESLRQTSSMTLRRLKRLRAEFAALGHTLNCALLLFRSCNLHNKQEPEK